MALHKVTLTERQHFVLFSFLRGAVQPKDRAEGRTLRGIFQAFRLMDLRDSADDGLEQKTADFSRTKLVELPPIETSSIVTTLGYLDQPGATALGSLNLLEVSEILLDAKEKIVPELPVNLEAVHTAA